MGQDTIIITLILFNIIFIAFVVGIIIFIRQYRIKKKSHEEELEKADQLHKEELLQTQVEIQNQTMKYIGREIHDNVGQKLTLSSLYLQQLLFRKEAADLTGDIEKINDVINDSLQELRSLSKSLTDDTINNLSLDELIAQECEKVKSLKECEIAFQSDVQSEITSYQMKSVLLRITQEFLQNSLKHARCKHINVHLRQEEDELLLELKDDGVGFDVETLKTHGIGLKNMQKRAEMIRGSYHLESSQNQGTTLTIKTPLT